MQTLPIEQNNLLKAMNEIDAQERAGVIPLRNNVNLGLIFCTWILAAVLSAISISNNRSGEVLTLGVATAIATIALSLAYYNKTIGFYAITFIAIVGNIYASLFFTQSTELGILFNAFTIFIVANQFFTNGYFFAAIVVAGKVAALYFLKGVHPPVEALVAEFIMVLTIGIIPVLMLSISKVSIRAKKQEIRAEILSLQNQDLISSWGSLFEKGAAPTTPVPFQSVQVPATTPIQSAPASVEPTPAGGPIYESQYKQP